MICALYHKLLSYLSRSLAWALILSVRLYQVVLGPILGGHCRFHPSCSAYFIGAVEKYGASVGTWKGLKRICRCHPWSAGGYDPP
jgi:uncharacterized protein